MSSMRWCDINLDAQTWSIPGEFQKNGELQIVPLGSEELEILQNRFLSNFNREDSGKSPFVFPGKGKTKHLLDPKKSWTTL